MMKSQGQKRMKKKLTRQAMKGMTGLLLVAIAYIATPFAWGLTYGKGYTKEEQGKMKIIAHRGGAALAPENTLACFCKGIEAGADMIELDIHLTKDGEIVVCHDQTVDRTTDGTGKIRDLTLQQIRQLHVVDADGNLTDEHLPTMQEVFDLVGQARAEGSSCGILIEIKRTRNIYQGIEEKLLQQISDNGARDWVIVQSFNDFALEKIHQLDPDIRLEKLVFCKPLGLPFVIDGWGMSWFSFKKYDYVRSFNFECHGLSKSLLEKIHSHGKEVKVWTLDGPETAPHLDVDGIITNRPDLWQH